MYDCVFSFIGKLFTLYFGIKFIYNIYHILRVYIFPTYPDFSKYGKWSVVTGATSGIGEEIAFQLASRGQNIISIARNKQKLEEVSKNIALRHGVLTKYLQIDFTEDESIYEKIKEFLKDHDIGVLVNNVGMAHPIGKFTEISKLPNLITNITRLNMLSALKMSQIVLPGMEQRNRGCVINVSSMSGLHVVPNFSMYAATKAFLKHFSEILSYECEDKGITVQCCCPYYIKTNMTAFLPHWKAMTLPEDYVRSLLATLGKERVTLGSIGFMLQNFVVGLVPLSILKRILNPPTNRMSDTQKKRDKSL